VQDLLGHSDPRQSERYAFSAVQEHQVAAMGELSKVARARGAARRGKEWEVFALETVPSCPDATDANSLISSEKWCARQDSNLRPTAPEAAPFIIILE
jgi:hypothetical protein